LSLLERDMISPSFKSEISKANIHAVGQEKTENFLS